jgi:hypothetical protein
MYCFNFKTKQECTQPKFEDALKNVTRVVAPHLRLNAPIEDCEIIELFQEKLLYISYPIECITCFEVSKFEASKTKSGKIIFRGIADVNVMGRNADYLTRVMSRYFSIKDDLLYIGVEKNLIEE